MKIEIIISLIFIILLFLFIFVRFYRKKEIEVAGLERKYFKALSDNNVELIQDLGQKLGESKNLSAPAILEMIQQDTSSFKNK